MMLLGNEYAIEFNHPVDRGAPDVVIGGATRCPPSFSFTPLIPIDTSRDYGDISPPYFSLTVRPNPTFWLHVPKNVTEIVFEIFEYDTAGREGRGKDGALIYSTFLDVPNADSFVSFSLPSDVDLQPGKIYRWYMDVVVGHGRDLEIVSTPGWIGRVEVSPELGRELARVETPLDRARVYAEAGIWHDAFEILVQEERLEDTPELEAEWEELLRSALGEQLPLPDVRGFLKC